jgi:hypothetical protein
VEDFLESVFSRHPNYAFHGLGIGRMEYILKYPFFSCDSSAWLYCRRKDKVITRQGQVKRPDLTLAKRVGSTIRLLVSLENRI